MTECARRGALVIGLGNELRGDDRFGIDVVRRLRTEVDSSEVELLELHGEPLELLELWRNRRVVVLVDTMRSGAPPGAIRRIDAISESSLGLPRGSCSTHALSLGHVIELARILDRLPARLTLYAVEGRSFDAGSDPSYDVAAAVSRVAALVREESLR